MDEADRKASMRAVWSKRQKYKHDVTRRRHSTRDAGTGGARGGRARGRPGAHRGVAEQRDRYDDIVEEGTVERGEDYEEWLAMCPKEPPEVLVRQRALLPDVDFLRRTLQEEHVTSSSVGDTGGLNLQYIASVLSCIPSIQDVLDVPDETMLVMFGQKKTRQHSSAEGYPPQSTPDDASDAQEVTHALDEKEKIIATERVSQESAVPHGRENVGENNKQVSVDDVLAAAMGDHLSLNTASDHPVSREEQDDLDAWFENL